MIYLWKIMKKNNLNTRLALLISKIVIFYIPLPQNQIFFKKNNKSFLKICILFIYYFQF